MPRLSLGLASLAALALLVGLCFGPAIAGQQFAFRDAAHYYYPLYQRVEAEWDAGRWPLWELEENGGMPLLGNPTAAVLYPGKLIYRVLPYPLAARVYVIAHTLLALAGAAALARGLGICPTGSVVAGAAYAFGGPVLFQYCNIIYLVGAAWLPWAFLAVDAWLRRGRAWAIPALGIALAMQVLGGDPQAAYLVGLCAGVYAFVLVRSETRTTTPAIRHRVAFALAAALALVVWVGVTLWLAYYLPIYRPKKVPVPTFWWNRWVPWLVAACWMIGGFVLFERWRRGRPSAASLGRRLAGLLIAAAMAGALAAAQLLPVIEFTGRTGRAAEEGTHDIYPFSLEPYRTAELLFPNVFGTMDRTNRLWLNLVPPTDNHKIWVDSLYTGAAVLALALVGLGGRDAPPWRKWMKGIAVISLLASFGEFASPIWLARYVEPAARLIGPHDPSPTNSIRTDGFLRDGDGSLYHLLSVAIPGFHQFRYPSKLLTLTTLALAVLAGHGWNRLESGARRAAIAWATALLGIAAAVGAGVGLARGRIVAAFASVDSSTIFGPLDPQGTFDDIFGAALHASCALAALLVVVSAWRRSPAMARAALVLLVALDLGLANRRLVATTDQADFERVPKALSLIAEAEKASPSPGPYRVHRVPIWKPDRWRKVGSPNRYADFVRWERDTLQPKYGLPYGVEYTLTHGVAELYDYEWFFSPWTVLPDRAIASRINPKNPDERIVYYPRRGFDMWNTRYFILPGIPAPTNPDRGIASFLLDTETIYPKPGSFDGPDGARLREEQLLSEDVQILRNRAPMPRAWVVHDLKFLSPIEGLSRQVRSGPMEEMLYAADPLWNDPTRHVYDPSRVAWVEVEDTNSLARFHPGGAVGASETVAVRYPSPERAELDVTLERPGVVVLADALYPGWTLTVDDKPATIIRTNRMMRGAAVDAGKHRLVYEYRPRSFAIGKVVTVFGFLGLLGSLAWSASVRIRPNHPDQAVRSGVRDDSAIKHLS